MCRLVQTEFTAAGKANRGFASPLCIFDRRALNFLGREPFQLGLKVVAHQVNLGSRQ
jgi:hypothetical protein